MNMIQLVVLIVYGILVFFISLALPDINSKIIFMFLVIPISMFLGWFIFPLFEDFNE